VSGQRAALALGSNLGERLPLLQGGIRDLVSEVIELVAVSSVYETDPVGGPKQGAYLNAVIVVETTLEPLELLARAHRAEAAQNRVRVERWGPRTLDVDVLSVAELVSDDPVLTLPHPRAHERGFVLVPWAEVDPTYVVPGLDATVAELLDRLPAADLTGVRLAYPSQLLTADVA
jgi:2-amino-4-hydroxy-6-hydroxymethyldihydropteridine diphosphokinase